MLKKKKLLILISWILIFCTVFSNVFGIEAEAKSKPPKFNAALTDKNMLKLVKAYDSDAYYFLNKTKQKGSTFSTWMMGSNNLAEAAETTVHEQFHMYTHTFGEFDWTTGFSDIYYLGNKKTLYINQTDCFKTEVVTGKLPANLRTFRYDTYVAQGASASSNQDGVYGLLNEFAAYYWGMHVEYKLYPYYAKNVNSLSGWHSFENDFVNDRDAYAEFYYWTLCYLDYARRKKPKVYKDIMNNKNYVVTFDTFRRNFEKLIKNYKKKLNVVYKKYTGQGYDGTSSYGGYRVLMKQINSKKFKKVKNDLVKKAKKYK